MRWSKTIQFGERILQSPLPRLHNSVLCPVSAYLMMCRKIHMNDDDPLFSHSSGKPITYSMFQNKLKAIISLLGLDPNMFSTHSFRRGFATFAFRNHVSADEIQILGDWKSDVYKRYISLSVNDKLKIFQDLEKHLDF